MNSFQEFQIKRLRESVESKEKSKRIARMFVQESKALDIVNDFHVALDAFEGEAGEAIVQTAEDHGISYSALYDLVYPYSSLEIQQSMKTARRLLHI